jgi:hypothetical protein
LVRALSTLSTNKRLKTALGGFVSFTGFIILVIVILTSIGAADMKSVFQSGVMIGAVAFLGFLDIFCGVLLFVKEEKKLKELFAPQKKKTDKDVK